MLIDFFQEVKKHGVPVTIRELLDLLAGLQAHLVHADFDQFYALSRAILVKDERYYDRFDRAFAAYFEGIESLNEVMGDIPAEWLAKQLERHLSKEEMARVESLGGFEKLMETLKQRLNEQSKRHQGGSKMIGTAGTSPFGSYGYNPEGVRIGQDRSRHRRAVKVWDKREFRDFDSSVELGTRSMKLALRKLRRFAREGAADELDLDNTINSTAANAGLLDIQMRPERRNAVKILMFLDVGGSMDDHVRTIEELFSAASSEFKHLEHFYFHNCLYEFVWQDNRRRWDERTSTIEVMNTFGRDYKVIIAGDATMSPYELTYPGGANEHWNEESGITWLTRLRDHWRSNVWINPQPQHWWRSHQSIGIVHQLFEGRMFPLTVTGIDSAMRELS